VHCTNCEPDRANDSAEKAPAFALTMSVADLVSSHRSVSAFRDRMKSGSSNGCRHET
jgi:hypothetical protein